MLSKLHFIYEFLLIGFANFERHISQFRWFWTNHITSFDLLKMKKNKEQKRTWLVKNSQNMSYRKFLYWSLTSQLSYSSIFKKYASIFLYNLHHKKYAYHIVILSEGVEQCFGGNLHDVKGLTMHTSTSTLK